MELRLLPNGVRLSVDGREALERGGIEILLANSAKLFRAPEGRRKLAGGGAKRNHRYKSKKIVRVPAGTPDQDSRQDQSRSGALSGRVVLSWRFRWLRFAPPPANIHRASGAVGVCQQYRCDAALQRLPPILMSKLNTIGLKPELRVVFTVSVLPIGPPRPVSI
jgi:hypothetical protein